jgi:hypothetical protein
VNAVPGYTCIICLDQLWSFCFIYHHVTLVLSILRNLTRQKLSLNTEILAARRRCIVPLCPAYSVLVIGVGNTGHGQTKEPVRQ